jgi:hypothetical protein
MLTGESLSLRWRLQEHLSRHDASAPPDHSSSTARQRVVADLYEAADS